MKYKGFSYSDGRLITTAYFDGYGFGDRLLEGVSFKAEIVGGELKVSFANPDGKYERGLNQQHWLKIARDSAEEDDVFNDLESLNGEDVVLETEGT